MQRRSFAQNESVNDLESSASSDHSFKSGRKSITSAVTERALHDVTNSKFFPMITLLMELSYHFVKASSEVYSVYGLAGHTSTLEQLEAMNLVIKYRYLGAFAVLPVGIVCDSYIGTFYPFLFFLCVLTALMGLHAVISLPWIFMTASTKLSLARQTFHIFAIFFTVEPLKLVIVSRAIMESNYFRMPRHFYAILACALNLGIGAGGTVIYFSIKSRYALCTIMFANFGLMVMYTSFYTVARRQFIGDKSTRKKETLGVVEKALAAIFCSALKYFDQYVLRKLIFKRSSGIEGDFRCFTLGQNTLKNARAIVGIALVTLPLIAALTMFAIIDVLYYVQTSMFYFYPSDPFPLLSLKGYLFLLMFPLMEFYIGPMLKKWSRNEASHLLTMVGIGAMCVSVSLCWSSGVHKIVRDGNEFWYEFSADNTGHIAITNCVNVPLFVRSQFINYILDDEDGWTTLPPFKTYTVLDVPVQNTPFHFEFSNTELAIYDEYFLPVSIGQSSWYLILPTGVFPLPPPCFRRNMKHLVVTTSFYGPATVCVVCALILCNGYVRFTDSSGLRHAQVNLVPLTGRGTNDSIAYDKIMTRLVGEYTISAILGGVSYTASSVTGSLSRSSTYMVVVHESSNDTNWEEDKEVVANTVEPTDDNDLIKNFFTKTSPRFTHNVEWMYPTVVFHALAEVTYRVSLWMFLFTHSPDQIRTTMFCFVETLCTPAYTYMYKKGAISLRRLKPLDYFYLATINCLFMILYFFCILFFIHKLFKVKPAHRSSVEVTIQKRQSVAPEPSDEQKGK